MCHVFNCVQSIRERQNYHYSYCSDVEIVLTILSKVHEELGKCLDYHYRVQVNEEEVDNVKYTRVSIVCTDHGKCAVIGSLSDLQMAKFVKQMIKCPNVLRCHFKQLKENEKHLVTYINL